MFRGSLVTTEQLVLKVADGGYSLQTWGVAVNIMGVQQCLTIKKQASYNMLHRALDLDKLFGIT
jgi:hypothetical protein